MADEKKDEKKEAYEFSIAGFKLKLNSAFFAMAIPIATTVGGAMWGAFEFYQDYLSMKKKIANYVAPDLSDFDKRLSVIEENSSKSADYTRDIKTDLKGDIRRNESVTEQVERHVKQAQRDMDQDIKQLRSDMEALKRSNETKLEKMSSVMENRLDKLSHDVESKIKKALDNPLNQ